MFSCSSVADLADRRTAFAAHVAKLAGGQLEQRVVAFLGHQLRGAAGAARHLAAAADAELDVVHRGAERDVVERQAVAGLDVGLDAGHDRVADRAARRAPGCSASRRRRSAAARCAPNGSDRTRWPRPSAGNAVLVAPEVDHAVATLVAAAAMARGDAAVRVAAAASS